MKLTLKPLADRVLVKALEAERESAGGIALPVGDGREEQLRGEVLAVGPGEILGNGQVRSLDVAVGECVVFNKRQAQVWRLEGEDYHVMREADIIGVIE